MRRMLNFSGPVGGRGLVEDRGLRWWVQLTNLGRRALAAFCWFRDIGPSRVRSGGTLNTSTLLFSDSPTSCARADGNYHTSSPLPLLPLLPYTLLWNGPSCGRNTSHFLSFSTVWMVWPHNQISVLALERVLNFWAATTGEYEIIVVCLDIWYSSAIHLGFWRTSGCWNFCWSSWIFMCFLGPKVISAAWHRRNSITFKARRESGFPFVPEKFSIACRSRFSRIMISRKLLRALYTWSQTTGFSSILFTVL